MASQIARKVTTGGDERSHLSWAACFEASKISDHPVFVIACFQTWRLSLALACFRAITNSLTNLQVSIYKTRGVHTIHSIKASLRAVGHFCEQLGQDAIKRCKVF
jgi:hypothetical protein